MGQPLRDETSELSRDFDTFLKFRVRVSVTLMKVLIFPEGAHF
jgi:hypothetical protein